MKRPSPALIAEWYGRLRTSGFRDIEGGRDLNKLDASTFRGARGEAVSFGRGEVVPWPNGFEPQAQLADHPTAVYYRELEHAAHDLRGRKRKLVLMAVNEGGPVQRGTRHHTPLRAGVTSQAASKTVRCFAKSIGLVREAHGS